MMFHLSQTSAGRVDTLKDHWERWADDNISYPHGPRSRALQGFFWKSYCEYQMLNVLASMNEFYGRRSILD